jgi:uncharacterized membrane protein YbhN (UPF0104 family)
MLRRLLENTLIRAGLLAAALAFCGLGLASDWPHVTAALARLHWYSVAGALVAAMAGGVCMMLAWRAVLSDLGSRLPVAAAARVSFISQVAKYLPGAVWALAAQIELGRDHRVPVRRSATAFVVSLAVTLETGLLVGTIALPLASASAARQYWWLLALTPLIALGLLPPVLGRVLDRALTLVRRQPLERRPSAAGLLTAIGWSAAGWALWGAQAWLLINDLTRGGPSVLLLSLGSYALAWSAGILLVVFPGGIGPRELAFIAALAPVMPRGTALVIALTSRVVMTASDLAWAGVGVAIGKLVKASRVPATSTRRRSPGKHRKTASQWSAAQPAAPSQGGPVPLEADSQPA